MPLPIKQGKFSFADYLTWDEDERIEIIDGKTFLMAAPLQVHQEISMELSRQLANFLEGKKCKVYSAPFGVRLFEQTGDQPEDVDTVVEPDICVICDKSKLDKHGCKGAPDLVIEIISSSSRRQDRLVKFNLYQRAGVQEYWIVDPQNKSVLVFLPDTNGFFRPFEDYGAEDVAKVNVLEGCYIELGKVFSE